jgi:hypothetical protein
MLELQNSFSMWRRQAPSKQTVIMATARPSKTVFPSLPRIAALAAAAMLGGILVAGGFFLGGLRQGNFVAQNNGSNGSRPQNGADSQPAAVVTSEQRREIGRAFALHESVAGPLDWYAADDATIQVAPSDRKENLQPPVAVVLRLLPSSASKDSEAKTFVIVCRDNNPAAIKLPHALFAADVRLQLNSQSTDKGVNLQYAVVADDSRSAEDGAALVGRRQLGLNQTSLGQIALNNRLVNVDASAWIVQDK